MKNFKNILYLVALFNFSVGSIYAQGGHEKNTLVDSLQIDGVWRTFEYHIPQFPTNNSRLVLVLHGDAMTSKSIQAVTGYEFNKLADKTGSSIVVYPQGYKNYWNDCRKEISFDTKKKQTDDVAFIKSIIQRMERRYHIDRKNVFATGYFNGGNMCYKLAKSIPEFFKGFAIVGANLSARSNNDCNEVNEAVSIMVINDIADDLNPFDGGEVTFVDGFTRGTVLSTEQTLDYWLSLLGQNDDIPLSSHASTIEKANSVVSRYDYYSKKKNKSVSFLKITKGGYPYTNPYANQWPQTLANTSKHINIPETVIRFFYQVQYSSTHNLGK